MKNFPYPDKKLKTDEDIRKHIIELVTNVSNWLLIDGYAGYTLLPGDPEWKQDSEAAMSISVQYPYKKYSLSVQQSEVEKCKSSAVGSPFWSNLERTVFHEMLHVILWRMEELARMRFVTPTDIQDENEAITDHLANAFHEAVVRSRKK